ncbi:MAG: FHA domain-containing protein [Thermoguttaceae bacterium]|nr:FHA domain-containing protein [Thermoguttaceae bacterium]
MKIRLTIYDDEKRHFSQPIALPCVVGRGRQCDVAIVHPLISRQHCEIYLDGRRIMARDLGSLNGTFYRGKRLDRPVELAFGDEFSIGALYFLVESVDAQTTTHLLAAKKAEAESEKPADDSVVDLGNFDQNGSGAF